MTDRRPLLAVPPLVGLVALVAATGKGLYVSPDAVFYVGTARNWLDGRGFTPPPGLQSVDHFPPLFTALLAALGRLGLDPLDGARLVNALSFAGVVLLAGLVVRSRTGSVPAALVASVLTMAAVDLLTYSGSALSEPLFVLLALSAPVVLAAYLDRPSPALLCAAGGLAGAAFLTRYVGAALVVAGVAGLLWRRRWVGAVVFGALSTLPVAGFLLLAEGERGARTVALHLPGWDYLGQAARPFSRWLVPWPEPPAGLVLALLVLVAGAAFLARNRPATAPSPLPRLLGAFALAYLALLLANRALVDASGRLDARFLLPLHVVAIVLVVPALHRRDLPRPALALGGLLVLAQVADATAWTVGGLTDDGLSRRGYTAAAWEESPILAHIGSTDERVYTNGFDAVFLHTGRTTLPIPSETDHLTGDANPRYADELAALRSSGGLVAYFDALPFRRSFLPARAELEAALPLEVVLTDALGTLYRLH